MMRIHKKNNIDRILGALVLLPLVSRFSRKRTSPTPYIVGGIGVAVLGALGSVLLFSPRTRTRALGAAKDGWDKWSHRLNESKHRPLSNGIVGDRPSGSDYVSGL